MANASSQLGDVRDEELLRAWVAGDSSASKELITRHYQSVFLFFYGKAGAVAAEDLTQTTFEVLCDKKVDFRGDSTVRTYLFGIARWKLVHYIRARYRGDQEFDPLTCSFEQPEVVRSLASLFAGRERERLLVRAIRSLPVDDQILLELKYYEGMTVRELAEVYQLPIATLWRRAERAKKGLLAAVETLGSSTALIGSTVTDLDACMQGIRDQMRAQGKR